MSTPRPKIHFKIDKTGDNVRLVDVEGAGQHCQEITSGVEKALGIVDEKSRESTSAAYQDVDPLKLTSETE